MSMPEVANGACPTEEMSRWLPVPVSVRSAKTNEDSGTDAEMPGAILEKAAQK